MGEGKSPHPASPQGEVSASALLMSRRKRAGGRRILAAMWKRGLQSGQSRRAAHAKCLATGASGLTQYARQMNRIDERFAQLRKVGRKGLIVYIGAGDPDLDATRRLALALDAAGVDVLELGVPFS